MNSLAMERMEALSREAAHDIMAFQEAVEDYRLARGDVSWLAVVAIASYRRMRIWQRDQDMLNATKESVET